MYKCNVCNKTYKTRTTLTRHAHNHTDGPNHTCEQCGVAFARRDILNRHLRQGHSDETATSRQRTHTACEPCRAARTKCDGSEPCRCCTAAKRTCTYSTASRRVSKTSHRRSQQQPNNTDEILPLSPPLAESDINFSIDVEMDDGLPYDSQSFGFEPDEMASALEAPPPANFANTNLPVDSVDIAPGLGNLPVDLDGMSWPWLHETLFLQNDPFDGLFDVTTTQQDLRITEPTSAAEETLLVTGERQSHDMPLGIEHLPADPPEPIATMAEEIDGLIEYATKTTSELSTRAVRESYWRAASSRLWSTFDTGHLDKASDRGEHHFLHQTILTHYMPKFNRLWPMFSRYRFDPATLQPILYLVLVSIGSMYGPDHQKHFGTLLHIRLRRLLASSSFDLENPEGDMEWLAHARLLTQVHGLYFGQRQGFSYAQVRAQRRAPISEIPTLTSHSTLVRYSLLNRGA